MAASPLSDWESQTVYRGSSPQLANRCLGLDLALRYIFFDRKQCFKLFWEYLIKIKISRSSWKIQKGAPRPHWIHILAWAHSVGTQWQVSLLDWAWMLYFAKVTTTSYYSPLASLLLSVCLPGLCMHLGLQVWLRTRPLLANEDSEAQRD